jgi:hypothetical protein
MLPVEAGLPTLLHGLGWAPTPPHMSGPGAASTTQPPFAEGSQAATCLWTRTDSRVAACLQTRRPATSSLPSREVGSRDVACPGRAPIQLHILKPGSLLLQFHIPAELASKPPRVSRPRVDSYAAACPETR